MQTEVVIDVRQYRIETIVGYNVFDLLNEARGSIDTYHTVPFVLMGVISLLLFQNVWRYVESDCFSIVYLTLNCFIELLVVRRTGIVQSISS